MTIITDLNAKIMKAIKENKMFWEFLEFKVKNSLIRYFDVLFSKKFLA